MLPEIVVPLDEVSSSGRAAPPPVASAPFAAAPSASAHSRPPPPASIPPPSIPPPSIPPPLAGARPAASTPAFVASPALAHSLSPSRASRRGFFPLLAAGVVIIAAGIWLALPSGGVLGNLASPEGSQLTPEPAPSVSSALVRRVHEVHLVLSPLDAQVYLGEKNLGPMPVSVKVEEGKPLVVSVRRKGYKPRRVVLDGSQTRIVVGLNKLTTSGR
jgi:hypothetical protein